MLDCAVNGRRVDLSDLTKNMKLERVNLSRVNSLSDVLRHPSDYILYKVKSSTKPRKCKNCCSCCSILRNRDNFSDSVKFQSLNALDKESNLTKFVKSSYAEADKNIMESAGDRIKKQCRCPLCNLISEKKSMSLMECYVDHDHSGIMNYSEVINSSGILNSVKVESLSNENLTLNSDTSDKSLYTMWVTRSDRSSTSLIYINDDLIQTTPDAHNLLASKMTLNDWKNVYHHRKAFQLAPSLYISFSAGKPQTHIWMDGVSLHIDNLVSVRHCQSSSQ